MPASTAAVADAMRKEFPHTMVVVVSTLGFLLLPVCHPDWRELTGLLRPGRQREARVAFVPSARTQFNSWYRLRY